MSSQERYKILLDMEREKETLDFQMLNFEIDQLIITEKKISEVNAEILRSINLAINRLQDLGEKLNAEMVRGVNLAISRLQDLREKLESEFERQNIKQIKGARKQKALYMLDDNEQNEQYFIG